MFDQLNELDHRLFLYLNQQYCPACDFIFYWFSNKLTWIPVYLLLALFLYRKYPRQFFSICIFIVLVVVISDQASSNFIKPAVMRLRPCHDPLISAQVHLVNNHCGGQYGFVSSHASNTFALTTFLVLLFGNNYKKLQWILIAWAAIGSYSRIYLGVHFPGDIICGALLGAITGFACYKGWSIYQRSLSA